MITVDDKDISTTWRLDPYRDNFYSAIMKDAGIKDRIVGDYPDTSGVIIPKGQSYTKSQELVLSFLCDSYDHYFAFLTYCVAQKVVNMYVSETDETLRLEYMACSSFNKVGDYNIFAVKFQEANPTRRYGVFAFCAPEGFDVQRQKVDIVDVYQRYDNVDKGYIFTLRDSVDKFALTQGTSAVHGYELNGVKYQDNYNVVGTEIDGTLPAGTYTKIPAVSTVGFPESGIIRYYDTASYAVERFRTFVYTSKTDTSFIGTSQSLAECAGYITSVLDLTDKINNWIIINGDLSLVLSPANFARFPYRVVLVDIFGGSDSTISVTVGTTYEWLYCGKNINQISVGSSGLGYGSVKYIHLESDRQLTKLDYTDFYGVPLTGELNIPKSITKIGSIDGYNYWVGFCMGYLTKVTISENVVLIVDSFNYHNTIQRFDCYPLIAPTIVADGNSFMNGHPVPLHIRPNSTGYNVIPWTNTAIFSEIIRDL